MKDKIKKCLMIGVLIIFCIFILIFTMHKIDTDRMKHGYDVVFSTWGREYEPGVHNIKK